MKVLKFKLVFAVLISVYLMAACAGIPSKQDVGVNHIVLIWFKSDTDASYIETVIRESRKMRQIPEVLGKRLGRAIESHRNIVDDSFDLGLVFEFADVEAMNTYLERPSHKDFVQKYITDKVKKLLVYDF